MQVDGEDFGKEYIGTYLADSKRFDVRASGGLFRVRPKYRRLVCSSPKTLYSTKGAAKAQEDKCTP